MKNIKEIDDVQPESQQDKFIKFARDLSCNEDEKAFNNKLRQIAKQPPKKEKPAD